MRIHYFQHVPFEGLGYIQTWLQERMAEVSRTRAYANDALPCLDEIDGLIVLGGPMSVNDTDAHPWLEAETRCIAEAIALGKPVLGICLGAQLIAKALGAKVYANPQKEIGWFPVYRTAEPIDWLPARLDVFHWHGETFDLPLGAVRLASSSACANQAFALGDNVLGLQFHMEVTAESVQELVNNCADELATGGAYVQSAELIQQGNAHVQTINRAMSAALCVLFGGF
jgi:GMP synthase-like glutamine amidotransferase